MAAPKKEGRVWRHRIMVAGERRSGTFDTKAAALSWEAEQRVEMSNGKVGTVTKTVGDAFDKYEIEVSRTKRGHRWEALRLNAMKQMALGKVRMCDLNPTHIAEWRDQRLRKVQGGSVTREMNLLSHVFSVARREWHWLTDNPMTDVSRPAGKPARDRRISEDEIKGICTALDWAVDANVEPKLTKQRVALAFLFAIETAMRAGEICGLKKTDVAGRVARLHITKNGLPRNVPLSVRALEIWSLVPDGFNVTPGTLDALFRRARDNTGIKGMTFHDTRHEAITRLAAKLNVLDLARMVGHSDIRQLQTYYNATAEDIAAKL
jgi:integrase